MVKIAVIHNIITPYRLDLFNKLSNHSYIDELNVFYCLERYSDRIWNINYDADYKYKILGGRTFVLPLLKLPCSVNLGILEEIRTGNYDAVIISGFTDITTQLAFIYCKINNIPIILWSELSGVYLSKYNKLYNPIIYFFIKYSDTILVPSTKSKKYHEKVGASADKIFLSPNTINEQKYFNKIEEYKKQEHLIKKELLIKTSKNIIFVGRLIKRKCIDKLIEAFIPIKHEFDDAGLIIVGNGPEMPKLQAFCSKNKVNDVYFTDFVDDETKIKYYSISTVLVLPSLWDIHPLVLPEAMACSLVLISTKGVASACDLVIDGENGYIVDTQNVGQLSLAIKKVFLSNDSELMGKKSLQILNKICSLDIAVDGFIDAIRFVNREK